MCVRLAPLVWVYSTVHVSPVFMCYWGCSSVGITTRANTITAQHQPGCVWCVCGVCGMWCGCVCGVWCACVHVCVCGDLEMREREGTRGQRGCAAVRTPAASRVSVHDAAMNVPTNVCEMVTGDLRASEVGSDRTPPPPSGRGEGVMGRSRR